MSKYKYILFDWNGTLLDDMQMNLEVENNMLKRRSLPVIESKEFYLEKFDFPVKAFYELCGFDFEKESYEKVCDEYAAEYKKAFKNARLFDDVLPVLKKLKENGIKLVIISASEDKLLKTQIDSFGISNYFEDILGTKDLKGTSKVSIALDWIKKNQVDSSKTVFIGDTTHDCETAEAIKCDCFLVSRGHNSIDRLKVTNKEIFSSLEAVSERILKP